MSMQMVMLQEFRKRLEQCWTKQTSFNPNGADGSSLGQCYVTALFVNELLGGKVMAGWIVHNGKRQHHFWNLIISGGEELELDFTSDQYGGDGISPVIKGEEFTKLNFKNPRFKKLKAKFLAIYK